MFLFIFVFIYITPTLFNNKYNPPKAIAKNTIHIKYFVKLSKFIQIPPKFQCLGI